MATMIYYNPLIFGIFSAFLACGYAVFLMTKNSRDTAQSAYDVA
jgi:ethanolamine permease